MTKLYYMAGRILAVNNVFFALVTVTVALRVYVRAYLIKRFCLDDWATVVGYVFFLGYIILSSIGLSNGFDQSRSALDATMAFLQPTWYSGISYILSSMFVKFSIALTLLRFAQCHRGVRYTLYVVTGVFEIFTLFVLIEWIIQCSPPPFYWTQYAGAKGTCLSSTLRVAAVYAFSGLNCLLDWTFALLPWLLVRQLTLANLRTKLMVWAVLGMGSIASIFMIVRMFYATKVLNTVNHNLGIQFLMWTCIELGLAIVASSAATLKPLVTKLMPKSPPNQSTNLENTTLTPGGGTFEIYHNREQKNRRPRSLDFSYFQDETQARSEAGSMVDGEESGKPVPESHVRSVS